MRFKDRRPVATIMDGAVEFVGIHISCGSPLVSLGAEVMPKMPFVVCVYCDNIDKDDRPISLFDQENE